jgi:hypothetical protein
MTIAILDLRAEVLEISSAPQSLDPGRDGGGPRRARLACVWRRDGAGTLIGAWRAEADRGGATQKFHDYFRRL